MTGTGLAVYSTDYEPQRLYSDGNIGAIDTALVETVVRSGDRPLDLYVDLTERQLLWSFKAERHTKSTRTGYFVAAYQGSDDEDLFRGFEAKLRQLHDSPEWAIPHTGDLRWDIGFELWRIPADVPGLSTAQFDSLAEQLRGGVSTPLEFGMRTHRSALQVVQALADAEVNCTVAIGAHDDITTLSTVDLLLQPGGDSDFEPRSNRASDIVKSETRETATAQSIPEKMGRDRGRSGSFLGRIAGATLLVFLGFAAYSFVEPNPVAPLTGLSTIGGLLGSIAAILTETWALDREKSRDGVGWLRDALLADRDRSMIVLAYGTLLGYAFPRVTWEVGTALGRDGFLFGTITTLSGAIPTAGAYVLGIFVISLSLLTVRTRVTDTALLTGDRLSALALGHIVYALTLVIATGFANSLWFAVIPAATA